MIILSKKAFCLILLGLATLAVASLCSVLQLAMHQAIIAFLITWIGLIAIFEVADFGHNHFPRDPTKQQ